MFGRRKTLAEHRALSCPNAGKQSGSVDPKPGKHARATDAVAIGHDASTRPEPKPDQFRTLDAQYQVFAHTRLLVVQGASGAGRSPVYCGRPPRPIPADLPRNRPPSPGIDRRTPIGCAAPSRAGARSLRPRWLSHCRGSRRPAFHRNSAEGSTQAANGGVRASDAAATPCKRSLQRVRISHPRGRPHISGETRAERDGLHYAGARFPAETDVGQDYCSRRI